jgi:hypothetical protein
MADKNKNKDPNLEPMLRAGKDAEELGRSQGAATKRMMDSAAAERNERSTSQGFAKMGRGGSASGESARADLYHREMQAAAEELSRLNRRSGSDYGRYGKK